MPNKNLAGQGRAVEHIAQASKAPEAFLFRMRTSDTKNSVTADRLSRAMDELGLKRTQLIHTALAYYLDAVAPNTKQQPAISPVPDAATQKILDTLHGRAGEGHK